MSRQRPVAEPYRIKMVEAMPHLGPDERRQALKEAGYNLFQLPAETVTIDLLTDSGNNAMSDRQWAGMMVGDEAYAGSRSFEELAATIRTLYGFPYVLPTHQGRAAEHVLAETLLQPGAIVPCNLTFATTEVLFEKAGARLLNVVADTAYDLSMPHPFKGNVDLAKLEAVIATEGAGRIPFISLSLTVNTAGGQPISLENLTAVKTLADRHGIPLYADAARAMENAFFIREREGGWHEADLATILRATMAPFAGAWISGKKDGLVNMGGFLALRDESVYRQARRTVVAHEGLHTYGGMSGRDLAAMAIGLRESTDLAYMSHRIGQVRYLADRLRHAGVPIVEPPGGHGVYVDAAAMASHLPPDAFPAQAIACALYLDAGVRSQEQGMAAPTPGATASIPLLRLALPRRVYTTLHLDVVVESLGWLQANPVLVPGLQLVESDPTLRFYTNRFEPIPPRVPD